MLRAKKAKAAFTPTRSPPPPPSPTHPPKQAALANTARSREISVARVRVALEVLAVDEALDPLLQVGRLERELELLEELRDEERV